MKQKVQEILEGISRKPEILQACPDPPQPPGYCYNYLQCGENPHAGKYGAACVLAVNPEIQGIIERQFRSGGDG